MHRQVLVSSFRNPCFKTMERQQILWSNLMNEITQNKFCITGVMQRVCWGQVALLGGWREMILLKCPSTGGGGELVALVSYFLNACSF